MWNGPLKGLTRFRPIRFLQWRSLHNKFTEQEAEKTNENVNKQETEETHKIPGHAGLAVPKYKIFRDEDSSEIFDVEEERQRRKTEAEEMEDLDAVREAFAGLNLKRGTHGVFDIEDLVDVLRKESAEDIFVCAVPRDMKYVDYMVICSGRSYRHMLATAEFVRRVFKVKRTKGDILPKIEGENSRDWMAMDLGNIALHIFSATAREEYDLESLWAIGPEYDRELNKPQDALVELFERHTISLETKMGGQKT